jgi:hypothetical protein
VLTEPFPRPISLSTYSLNACVPADYNNLSGPLPSELGLMSALSELYLGTFILDFVTSLTQFSPCPVIATI